MIRSGRSRVPLQRRLCRPGSARSRGWCLGLMLTLALGFGPLGGLPASDRASAQDRTSPQHSKLTQDSTSPRGRTSPQEQRSSRRLLQPNPATNPNALLDLRRRLIELDRLLALESVGRAEKLLEDLEQHSMLARECLPRRVKLYQIQGRHEEAAALCREALADRADNAGLWRSLAESLLHLQQGDAAREALNRFLLASPDRHASGTVAVEMLRGAGFDDVAVSMIDSLRTAFGDLRYLGRARALGLLAMDRQTAAADEISAELQGNPFNLSLIRVELLEGPFDPVKHQVFIERLRQLAAAPDARIAQSLLVANLALSQGDGDGARALVLPRLGRRSDAQAVLRNTVTLGNELPLLENGPSLTATVDYLLAVLAELIRTEALDTTLRHRAADQLADVCAEALEAGVLGDDPPASAERFSELLGLVRRVNPASQHLYSSQIKLARFTRDKLHEPLTAARRLEHLLLDLDLPSEGLALVRLTLGECYFAAGDTARGRTVLTRLGRDREFRQAAGHAHYHLARLDLAEGHFATARDRFAVVALDNPSAPYANDALELGLAIAEELENPSGGPAVLAGYARSVYYDLTARPDSQLVTLERFVRSGDASLDLEEKQHVLERARFELAALYEAQGRTEEALATWTDLTAKHPSGRFPATALARRGQLLLNLGRTAEAQQVLEQLLSQYPDYLFIADVRDQLRNLP